MRDSALTGGQRPDVVQVIRLNYGKMIELENKFKQLEKNLRIGALC